MNDQPSTQELPPAATNQPDTAPGENYVIHWVSRVNGVSGRGTHKFTQKDAQHLADELNKDYPHIAHRAVPDTQWMMAQVEQEVDRLKQSGWKQPDFAEALKQELQPPQTQQQEQQYITE